MGAGLDKDASGHYDKRTLRLMNAADFSRALRKEKMKSKKAASQDENNAPNVPSGSGSMSLTEQVLDMFDEETARLEQKDCKSIIRKRPLFDSEREKGEFDVILCKKAGKLDSDEIAIYNCQRHMNGKDLYMTKSTYNFSSVYSEDSTTREIFETDLEPAVRDWVDGVSGCTLFMYGQTGSGKSYTISGLLELSIETAFAKLGVEAVDVSIFEIRGSKCFDLLATTSETDEMADNNETQLKEVFLREENGEVHVRGLTPTVCTSIEETLDTIKQANDMRATQSTAANNTSSRSHAVYQITRHGDDGSERTVLTLVDLAGSERSKDSLYHTEERQKETIEINVSLNALKDCIRMRIQQEEQWKQQLQAHQEAYPFQAPILPCKETVHMPFRRSALTRVLKASLQPRLPDGMELTSSTGQVASGRHKTILIATVSPCATDTEHSASTLEHASLMAVSKSSRKKDVKIPVEPPAAKTEPAKKAVVTDPKEWSFKQVQLWIKKVATSMGMSGPDVTHILRKFDRVTGTEICRFTRNTFEERCEGNRILSNKLFLELSSMKRKLEQKAQREQREKMRSGGVSKTKTAKRPTSTTTSRTASNITTRRR